MRLPIGKAATNRRADAGRDVGVDEVEVDGHMDERRARNPLECLAEHGLHAAAVDVRDRVDREAAFLDEVALAWIEAAHADDGDVFRIDRR